MALLPFNSIGGFSVGEVPVNIILANGDITSNNANFTGNVTAAQFNGNLVGTFANLTGNIVTSNITVNLEVTGNTANFSGNIKALGLLTDNLYYANGQPWDLQQPGGSNTQVQFNDADQFGGSANFTFDKTTNLLTVGGNISGQNVNAGNLLTANFVTGTLTTNAQPNITSVGTLSSLDVSGNVAAGGVKTDNLYYANGTPWDLQEAAGANYEIQYNLDDNFAASANFKFNPTTDTLTVTGNANVTGTVNTANINSGTSALAVTANGFTTTYQANGEVAFPGNISATTFVGNFSGNVSAAGSNTQVQYNNDNVTAGSSAFTFNNTTNTLTVSNTVSAGNLQATGLTTTANLTVNNEISGNTANFSGNVVVPNLTVNVELAGNTANFSGNVQVNNLDVNLELTGATANFTSNVQVNNLGVNLELAGNTANFTGNVQVNNLDVNLELSGNTANFTGNIKSLNADLGNLATANYVNVSQQINGNIANFSGNLTSLNAALGNLATANYVNVANDLNVVGNVNAGNLVGTFANGTSNIKIYQDSNVEVSVGGSANLVTFTTTGLYVDGEIQTTAGNMLANGNITANGFLVSANIQTTGEANVGSLLTPNITATSGNLTISAAGSNESIYLVPTGSGVVDVSGKRISQVADPVNPNDAATKEYVDAIAGSGLTIHTPVDVEANSALNGTYAVGGTTQTTTDITGGKTITFSANHGLSINDGIVWTNSFNGITGGEAYWVQTVPALNQITVRDGYFGVEVTTLTNGTGLSQASRANPGVGATLTNAGANAALQVDGIAVANGWRVLVYSEANAAHNGIYDVTDTGNATAAWVLTRSSDMDKYIPASPNGMSKGDYTFVTKGATGAGESYVLTVPEGEIIIGTDNITFTQFSSAGSYTAGNGISITGTLISANVDNDTTAISGGNIVVKSGANLTTPNIGDATFSSLTWNNLSNGNVSANNLSISSIANITGAVTLGNTLQVNGTISSNANVSGLNLTTNGNVSAGGNVVAANLTANSTVFAANANVSGTTITNALTVNNAITGNTANFSGNIVVNNATVNVELAGNTANFSGNVIVPNLTVNLELAGNTANFSGNIKSANADLGNLAIANFVQTGEVLNGTSNIVINSSGNIDLSVAGTSDVVVVTSTGANITGYANVTGNVDANNVNAANIVSANVADIASVIELGNTTVKWNTITTTSTTANQTIASFAVSSSGMTAVEFIVKGSDSTGSKYSVATVQAVTDGTTANFTTFATAFVGNTTGVLAVNVAGSNLELQVTPSSSNSTTWTTQFRTL